MKRIGVLALSLIMLLAGMLLGAVYATDFWMGQSARSKYISAEISLYRDLRALKDIRDGREDRARERLEEAVDFYVGLIDVLKKEDETLEEEYSSLSEVAKYRETVDYKSDDERVTRALSAAREQHLTPQSSGTPR